MADTYSTVTIDELTEVSTATDNDLFVISQNSSTKTITKENLLSPLQVQINELADIIESGGSGLTDGAKQALLNCFAHVAWIDESGQSYYTNLFNALYPPVYVTSLSVSPTTLSFAELNTSQQLTATVLPVDATESVTWESTDTSVATVNETGLVTSVGYGSCYIECQAGSYSQSIGIVVAQATLTSISAVYTQSGTVYNTDSLDSLKSDLVVTATWSNSTTSVLTDSDYVLSGALSVGTSTITVSYGGQTTTFNVAVTEYVVTEVPITWSKGTWQDGTGDSWVANTSYNARNFTSYLDASSHVLKFKFPIDSENTYVTSGVTTCTQVYVRAYDPTDDSYVGQLSLSNGTIGSSSASMSAQTITFGQEYTLLQSYRYRMIVGSGGAFSANSKRQSYLNNMFTSMYY